MKRNATFLLVFAILICVAAPYASAAEEPMQVGVYFDGERIDRRGLSFSEDGKVYVPLSELCEQFESSSMSWDKDRGEAQVLSDGLEFKITEGYDYVLANDRTIYMEDAYRDIDGVLMVPARQICQLFGAEASWNGKTKNLFIYDTGEPLESGTTFYDEDELYWLSRIIQAESGGECLEGKIAVGNVIMNRVESDMFPDTVYDVIFDRRCGIQFSPAYSGSIYNEPCEEAVIAAKLVLEGVVVTENALYFTPNRSAETCWASRNRPYDTQIGGHTFFA